jgi:hemoglobin
MPACRRRMAQIVLAVLLCTVTPSRASAQDTKLLDQRIYDTLKDVINTGADIYNLRAEDRDVYTRENNRASCYRIYQGSLLTLQPLLGHHPDLQRVIDLRLAKAATQNSMAERAFTLREALDEIRRVLKPGGEGKAVADIPLSDKGTMPGGVGPTLWIRLGGEVKVTKIVDDLMTRIKADPKVNFFLKGKFAPTDLELQNVKTRLVEYVSAASKGPKTYTGRSMASVHKGMGITDAEFTAMIDDLKQVLIANNVPTADGKELLQLIESTRRDIVEAKDTKAASDNILDGFKKPK